MSADERPLRVLVAGGGIAGLEALLALRDLAGDRVELTLAAPEPEFTYRPLLVEEPFSATPAERRALPPLAKEVGARLVPEALARVRADDRVAELAGGTEGAYDAAVICVGGRPRPAYERATTFRVTGGEPMPIEEELRAAAAHPSRRIAFVVPPGVSWALPIYEVALMAERRARELKLELDFLIVTPESAPLIIFGPVPSDAVAAVLEPRGVRVLTGTHARETDEGIELVPGDEPLEAGAVIALPLIEGPRVEGLPADEHGFIPIDDHARVAEVDGVYAAGDGTNFPIKQGGLATQQADAAAEHIAARAGAEVDPQPFHPVLRGRLFLGDESISLSADVTGGAGEGRVSPDYLWWPPHKVAGRYLAPFLAGEAAPFADEPPSHGIEVEVALPKEWHREPMALDPYAPLGRSDR